jgi:hypothetical protein
MVDSYPKLEHEHGQEPKGGTLQTMCGLQMHTDVKKQIVSMELSLLGIMDANSYTKIPKY